MKRTVGWRCDSCGAVNAEMPWSCPGCKLETCDTCMSSFGHCRKCSEGKSDSDLAKAANATGEWDFETEYITEKSSPINQ